MSKDEKLLLEAAKAYRDLCICYRLGKRPSAKLFTRLTNADTIIEYYEERTEQ